jgi:hypothetical protein
MSEKKQFRGTDLLICSLFPVSVVLFVLVAALVHGPWGRFASAVGLFVVVGSVLALPLWVVLHIIFNGWRTATWALWLESGLAGVWLAFGSYSVLITFAGGTISSLIAGLIGAALALTPYTVRFVRSSESRAAAE